MRRKLKIKVGESKLMRFSTSDRQGRVKSENGWEKKFEEVKELKYLRSQVSASGKIKR